MYYYGGYNNMNSCSCGNSYTPYMYGYTGGNNAAIVLVLFILLVIILGARVFNNN